MTGNTKPCSLPARSLLAPCSLPARSLRSAAALGMIALALAASPAHADYLYAGAIGTDGHQLYAVNTDTGAASVISTISSNFDAPTSFSFVNNTLYATSYNGLFGTLDPTTGNFSPIASLGFEPSGFGLTPSQNGFYTETNDGQLYTLLTTGALSYIGGGGQELDAVDFDAVDDVGYGYSSDDGDLYKINTTTGALSLIGATGITPSFDYDDGMGYDANNGQLYLVFGDSETDPQTTYDLNLTTGLATVVGPTGTEGISGMGGLETPRQITVPGEPAVPEPSSFALLGLALPAIGLMVRRRVRK